MSDVTGRLVLAAAVVAVSLVMASASASAARHDYGDALSKSLLYFESQRSGRLPYNQRVRWRGHSGLTDGLEQGVDLVGGYYDAGDHVKFGLPMAFTVTMLSWAVLEYGDQIAAAGEGAHALQSIKWGTDYFIKAHTAPNELWTQVGDGDSDHYCWQRPEDMTTSRRAYKVDAEHPGSEVAAETAAAMAAASIVFRRAGDAHYAHLLLHHAQQLFEFADKYRGRYDASVRVVKSYYPSASGYNDELLWAALWLHRATGGREYLDYVVSNADEFGGTGWGVSEFSWDIKYPGLQILASKLLLEEKDLSSEYRAVLEKYRAKAEFYVCSNMNKNPGGAARNAPRTPAGLIFIRPWNNLQYVTNAVFLLTVHSDLLAALGEPLRCTVDEDADTSDTGGETAADVVVGAEDVLAFAKAQADYILGTNPMGTSYLVGYSDRYPRRVHHRAASTASLTDEKGFIGCTQGFDSWYSAGEENPHDLVGAVVGGPDGEDRFNDQRGAYMQTEACTYNTAPMVGVFSRLMELDAQERLRAVAEPGIKARAMMAIQDNFGVVKNWMGDPCTPKAFVWRGLNCSYPPASPSEIMGLNLSSFGLVGAISTNFRDIKALQYLDLSHNNLSGPIPNFLGQLSSLMFLDLSSNDLSGPIPYSLLQRSQNGSLSLRVGGNANLCGNGTACRPVRKKINGTLLAAIVVPIVIAFALFVILFLLRQAFKGKAKQKATGHEDGSALLGSREFSYKELKHITNNFSQEIGKGGFGPVFLGCLENGNPVAVKVRSESSSQGGKEFLAEAQHLTRIHHKNLVSLIGYCKDRNHLALVYEYMPEGSLQDHLRATSTSKPLTWKQRLQIALDAAQGLEYLHIACKPALIHRDVKSRNILLTTDLGAKIADFGLTKAFSDSETHITTEPAGTIGYLDPEYFRSYHISEKSDLYSFGVVLLELITGHAPVIPISDSMSIHISEWVHESLDHGNIESIVDGKMGGDYDINSVWKAADVALHCKQEVSRERPTMAEVVAQLKECLELENRRSERRGGLCSNDDDLTCPGEGSALEAEETQQGGEIQTAAGPAMR